MLKILYQEILKNNLNIRSPQLSAFSEKIFGTT